MQTGKPVDILMVEDNEGDVRLALEAFKRSRVQNRIRVARDGVEAWDLLKKRNGFADAPRPDIILLDLNLPRKDGRELLADLKQDPDLRRIPVVILTTSQAEEDIVRSYDSHANCYITKPIDMNQFFRVIASVEDFWLTVVKLPKSGPGSPA